MDDLKISHVDANVVQGVVEAIEKEFGEMKKSYGKKHQYLGMDLDLSSKGEVKISMVPYILDAIETFGEDCSTPVGSPAAKYLLTVRPKSEPLPEEKRKLFHKVVAKLLYITKRARPDLIVAVNFLCGRVTKATKDDWNKLHRCLRYLKSTIDLPLTISIDDMTIVHTFIDAAFAVHDDMKSHTGTVITMGKGALYASSNKQKLNTKSSTEAELVGAGDMVGRAIWTANFLEEQGYKVKQNNVYQDNQSAIKMEVNGRQSASPRSRHINIKYFFIKDYVEKGKINVIYCPTENMIADFASKPTTGKLFEKQRDQMMGVTRCDPSTFDTTQDQERVGSRDPESKSNESKTVTWADVVRNDSRTEMSR